MNPEYEPYEIIDRYLHKAMSQEELLHFEERLSTDEDLQELLEAQKIANEYLIDQELLKLKNRMQLEMNSEGKGGNTLWGKILITSSAVLMAGGALYLMINADPVSSPQNEIIQSTSETIIPENNSETEKTKMNSTVHATTAAKLITTPLILSETKKPILTKETEEVYESSTIPLKEEKGTPKIISTPLPVNETIPINCDLTKIEANAQINYGFFEEEEPQIVINKKTIRGGTAPYSFSLDNKSFTNETSFEQVKDGTYHVYIKDQHDCVSELNTVLVVKKPVKEIDQSFSPAYGSRWSFPLKNNTDGAITIFNKAGNIVYTANITGGYPNDWDGRDNSGKELDSGNYSFIINFVSNEFVKGHITIFK